MDACPSLKNPPDLLFSDNTSTIQPPISAAAFLIFLRVFSLKCPAVVENDHVPLECFSI